MVLKINSLRLTTGKTIIYFHLYFSIEGTVPLTQLSLPKSFWKAKEIKPYIQGSLIGALLSPTVSIFTADKHFL